MRYGHIFNNVQKEDSESIITDLCFWEGFRPLCKDGDVSVFHLVIEKGSGIHIIRYKNTRKVSIAGHHEDFDMMMEEIRNITPTVAEIKTEEKGANRPNEGVEITALESEEIAQPPD